MLPYDDISRLERLVRTAVWVGLSLKNGILG
jgi:hypothetical protein